MSGTPLAESGRMDTPECGAPLGTLPQGIVEVLLDVSEENSVKEQEACGIPNRTGWDEIQGWGQCSPFSCLFVAQQKSKKLRPEISASHCVLCTDLKLSERSVASPAASETSNEIPPEPSRNSVPAFPEHLNGNPGGLTSTSSSEEEATDFTLKERSIRKDLLDKILPHPPQPDAACLFGKDRTVGKVALLGRVMVLPPVKVPTNPKSSNVLKRREDSAARPVVLSEKTGAGSEQEKEVGISNSSPSVGTSQGSPVTSKQGPTQHQYQLLSALNISRRYQFPSNTVAEVQPSTTSLLERSLRQEERIRSPVRHNSGYRSRLGLKDKSLRRAEPELPMLLGTRVQIPVSAQRLL